MLIIVPPSESKRPPPDRGRPVALADVRSDRWPLRLAEPIRPGRPWTLTLTAND